MKSVRQTRVRGQHPNHRYILCMYILQYVAFLFFFVNTRKLSVAGKSPWTGPSSVFGDMLARGFVVWACILGGAQQARVFIYPCIAEPERLFTARCNQKNKVRVIFRVFRVWMDLGQ